MTSSSFMTQYKSFAYNKQYKRKNDIPCVFILYFIYIKAPKLSVLPTIAVLLYWRLASSLCWFGLWPLTHTRISRSLPQVTRKSTRNARDVQAFTWTSECCRLNSEPVLPNDSQLFSNPPNIIKQNRPRITVYRLRSRTNRRRNLLPSVTLKSAST